VQPAQKRQNPRYNIHFSSSFFGFIHRKNPGKTSDLSGFLLILAQVFINGFFSGDTTPLQSRLIDFLVAILRH
jgi:hypothetical protein